MARLRIGSRGSQLARWQAEHVAGLLRSAGHDCEIQIIRTTGDRTLDVPLAQVGSKGMFIKEIEEALAAGEIDLAVHSLKDLPTDLAEEFEIAAVLPREDARDALVSQKYSALSELPPGAGVGTSSLRREAQLRAVRADIKVLPLRGNVDTRLRKVETGDFDVVILASAGLKRLGRSDAIRAILAIDTMCPAPGQGALAIETRKRDRTTTALIGRFDDRESRLATSCERELLRALGGGCQVPIGAHATVQANVIRLHAVVASPDGTSILRASQTGSGPLALGQAVASSLRRQGADGLLESLQNKPVPAAEQP